MRNWFAQATLDGLHAGLLAAVAATAFGLADAANATRLGAVLAITVVAPLVGLRFDLHSRGDLER